MTNLYEKSSLALLGDREHQKKFEELPVAENVLYTEQLKKWARARGIQTKLHATTHKTTPESETYILRVEITCNVLGSCFETTQLAEETQEQCKQRAARNFLNCFVRSPLSN